MRLAGVVEGTRAPIAHERDRLAIGVLEYALLSVGFRISSTQHKPSYLALSTTRRDEFGVENRYLFACFAPDRTVSDEDVSALKKVADYENSALVVIGALATARADIASMTTDEFLGRLGGPVSALLPLDPEYPERLGVLGHNSLPAGMAGKPDTLFEEYVHAGLQFILQDRVVRYGQERLFEAVSDGLVAGNRSPLMLYDAKAARDGYEVSADAIRQFGDYVRAFHSRYENLVGRLYGFLLVSGHFETEGRLEDRSSELYAACNVPLRYLVADEMAKIVELLAERHLRSSEPIRKDF